MRSTAGVDVDLIILACAVALEALAAAAVLQDSPRIRLRSLVRTAN